MNRNLTDTELSKVCVVIEDILGLNFPVANWDILGRNLASAASEAGFQNMDSFIQWILSDKLNEDEISFLAAHLTTSETYFWREPEVFTALTDYILPWIIELKNKGEKSINIWSSGCSSGEEPYSIAIALHKTIPDIKDWKITILATDINQKALDKGAAGIYGTWSFRNTPEWLKECYFIKLDDKKYEVIPEIKNMVTFGKLNLADDKYSFPANATKPKDIIFCRNVLMYFTEKWVSKISQNFFNSLSDDGWFVVSSAELSSHLFAQFISVNFPGAILYRKAKIGSLQSLSTLALYNESSEPVQPSSTPSTIIHHSVSEGRHLTLQPLKPLQPCLTLKPSLSIAETPEKTNSTKVFAIHLLAGQGNLHEALFLCNEAIASEKLMPGLYFLRASILQEMDRNTEAIASLKQAIYLDPDYIMGYFALGNLFNQKGSEKSAIRYFNNVLDLLEKYSNDDILSDSDGLSVKYIREIIFANMESMRKK
jgi:chemotaxis protein methyltransferase CheR